MAESSSKDSRQFIKESKTNPNDTSREKGEPLITIIDCFRILFGLLLLNSLLSYFITGDSYLWNYNPYWIRPKALVAKLRGPVVLTDAQLLTFAGTDPDVPILLALNGTIYDVSSNPMTYGPGGPYHVFAGRDATRAFVTGCFAEDNVPDYRGVEWTFVPRDVPRFEEISDELLGEDKRQYRRDMLAKAHEGVEDTIKHWAKMFRGETGKDYFEVGYVRRDEEEMMNKPMIKLCGPAEKKRPKKSQLKPKIEGAAQADQGGKQEL